MPTQPTNIVLADSSNTGLTSDNITRDSAPLITGEGHPGEQITLATDNGGAILGTTIVDADGNWAFQIDDQSPLVEGTHNITATATATDPADTDPPVDSATVELVIDLSTEPAAITSVTDGSDPIDGPTDTASIVISGTAEDGSTVTVYLNGEALENPVVATGGTWEYTYDSTDLASGNHAFTASATDVAGNTQGFTVVIDKDAPAAPVVTGVEQGEGDATVDGTTSVVQPEVSGTAEPYSTVLVFADGVQIGMTTADAGGNWTTSYAMNPITTDLTPGAHAITATATANGRTSDPSDAFDITVDAEKPAAPAITGVENVDGSISNTVSMDAADINDTTPVVTGTAVAGNRVTLTIDGNEYTGTADSEGAWSIPVTNALGLAGHAATVTQTDAAGNVSDASASVTITVDTAASSAPTINNVSEADNDNDPSDFVTSDTTPTISGIDGTEGDTITVTVGSGPTAVVIGTGVVAADGSWSVDFEGDALTGGNHAVTATATDPAGNVSVASSVITLEIDTMDPVAPTILLADGEGPSDDRLLNTDLPVISGEAGPEAVSVEVFAGTTSLGKAPVTAGIWSLTPEAVNALDEGNFTLTAVATDAVGNTSDASGEFAIEIDTVDPTNVTVTTLTDDSPPVGDGVTNDNTPTVSGTAETGSVITITLDPSGPGSNIDLGPVTADVDGNWSLSYTGPGLPDDEYDVTVTATDAAGNTTVLNDTLVIDTQDPTVTGLALESDPIDAMANPTLTADATPEFSFTAEDGATVEIDFGDGDGFVEVDDGTGSEQRVTKATPYTTDGVKNIQVRVTDLAGNQTTTTVLPITINFAPTDLDVNNDKVEVSATGGTVVSVISVTDASTTDTHTYGLKDAAQDDRFIILPETNTIVVNPASGHPPLVVGDTYTVTVVVTDAGGNEFEEEVEITVEAEQVVGSSDPSMDGSGDGEVTGTFTDDTIDAGAGDDTVSTGAGEDDVTLGDGADTIKDTLSNLNGDTVQDFGEDDEFVFTDGDFGADDVEVAADGQSITITSGGEETTINLGEQLSGGSLLVFEKGGETVVSYEQDLITLEEGSSIDTNGANGIVSQSYLTGDGNNDYRITLDASESGAAAKNLLGVYEIASDGAIGEVSLVFADTSGSVDLQQEILNVSDGAQLGFFLVTNGAGLVTDPNADVFTFSGAGATANISDGANLDLLINGTVVSNNVFHSFSPNLNGDGIQHAVSGAANNGIQVGFEDLWGGGDRDYQDVVFSVVLGDYDAPI